MQVVPDCRPLYLQLSVGIILQFLERRVEAEDQACRGIINRDIFESSQAGIDEAGGKVLLFWSLHRGRRALANGGRGGRRSPRDAGTSRFQSLRYQLMEPRILSRS
jgi:hypothetical protein